MIQQATDWQQFFQRWSQLRPPFRIDSAVIEKVAALIAEHDAHVLLLGVTPELANLGLRMTAVDWSSTMLDHIWPGNTAHRRAVLADWRSMDCFESRPTAVIGDGSFGCLAWPDAYSGVFDRLKLVLEDGGRVAIRCYIAPDEPDCVADIIADLESGELAGFHAFKLRFAMSVVTRSAGPNVAVKRILSEFDVAFPDRAALAEMTGWSLEQIGEMDAYGTSGAVYSFVTRAEMMQAVPKGFVNARFEAAGNYELADRCPLLVMDYLA